MKYLLALSIVIAGLIIGLFVKNNDTPKLGFGIDGGSLSTTTESFGTGAAYESQVLKTGAGVLDNVVVTLTSNAGLLLCNATTTGSQMGTVFSTTTQCFSTFKTTTVGTYDYNVAFSKGLIAISNTAVGMASTTITYR